MANTTCTVPTMVLDFTSSATSTMRSPRAALANAFCQKATALARGSGCMKPTEAPPSTQSSNTSASASATAGSALAR
jgi:hypothetical protein